MISVFLFTFPLRSSPLVTLPSSAPFLFLPVCSSDLNLSLPTVLSHPEIRLAYLLAICVISLIRFLFSSHMHGLRPHECIIAPLANKPMAASCQRRELVHRGRCC